MFIKLYNFIQKIRVTCTTSKNLQGLIKRNPSLIQYVNNPSEDLVILSIENLNRERYYSTRNLLLKIVEILKSPSDKVLVALLKTRIIDLGDIAKFYISDDVKIAAIKYYPPNIDYIENPNEEMLREALYNELRHGGIISRFDNLDEGLQLLAVDVDGSNVQYLNEPSEEVKLKAIQKGGFRFIKNPTDEMLLEAVKVKWSDIQYMINPPIETQLEAIFGNWNAIKYIKNPSPQVELYAVMRDWRAIQYINNPSETMLRYAMIGRLKDSASKC